MFDKTVGDMRTMCFVLKQNPPLHLCPNMGAAKKKEARVTHSAAEYSKYNHSNLEYLEYFQPILLESQSETILKHF